MIQYSLNNRAETYTDSKIAKLINSGKNESINKYQRIIDELPYWIWETDEEFKVISTNENVYNITGFEPSKIIGLSMFEIILPNDSDLSNDIIYNKLNKKKDSRITINHRIRHRDKSIHYLNTKIIANYDSSKNLTGYIGLTLDQTPQAVIENTLKETETNLELVLGNLTEIVYKIDHNCCITFASPAIKLLFGLKPENILGKPFYSMFYKLSSKADDIENLKRYLKNIIIDKQTNLIYELEINYQNKSCTYEISGKLFYDSENNFSGGIGSIRDITKAKRAEENMHAAFNGTIDAIAEIVEQRDVYTSGHQRNVSKLSVAIAHKLKLSEERIEGLRIAAMLHDVGKVSIPTEILTRPTKLNEAERRIIEMHPKLGANILRQVPFPWDIARFVEEHHERIDGSGYPYGLKGKEISLEARIIGVADSLDSLLNHRPYKPAHDINTSLRILLENRGTKFDADVVDAVIVLYRKNFFESYISNIAQFFR